MERLYYLSHRLFRWHVSIVLRLLMVVIRLLHQSFLFCQTIIGPGVSFGHKQGIVIARTARIGARCTIRHQVTIADSAQGAAIVGDDLQIGAGAKWIGRVTIGNRVRVGANAVVVDDVPDDATVVGIPAQVVRVRSAGVQPVSI